MEFDLQVFTRDIMGLLSTLKWPDWISSRKTSHKIAFLEGYNWFGLNNSKVSELLEKHGRLYISVNLASPPLPDCYDLPPQLYKGINLDSVIAYSICNELEVMPDQINFQNQVHLQAVKKWRSAAKEYIDQIYENLEQINIDKIVIPQGYVLEAATLRLIAIRLGVPIFSIENSLHKDKMLWDNVTGITVNRNLSKNFYWKFKEVVDPVCVNNFVDDYLNNIKSHKVPEHTSPDSTVSLIDGTKVVLFLGQVYVDSSVLFNLYDFECPERLIDNLCQYCIANDYTLLVKLHPKEVTGNSIVNSPLNKLTLRKLQQLPNFDTYISRHNVIIDADNNYDTYDVIKKADAVVTINSMSGLEACIMNKPVITCGLSSYSGLGFTSEAKNKNELFFFLNQVLTTPQNAMDSQAARTFFYIYLNLYCFDKNEETLVNAILRQ
jgi:Capsule polysaccharide export protein